MVGNDMMSLLVGIPTALKKGYAAALPRFPKPQAPCRYSNEALACVMHAYCLHVACNTRRGMFIVLLWKHVSGSRATSCKYAADAAKCQHTT